MKKAQGLSLNTIIIAALVIMVLVILALVFTGQMGDFGKTSKSCVSKGGECRDTCLDTESTSLLGGSCADEQICCVPKVA